MTHLKTRNLSLLEYLECLVREYMVAELRRKVYSKRADKAYWGKVCEWKEEKIRDITERNGIPNMFDNREVMKKYRTLYYPTDQIPLLLLCKKDLVYYFSENSDVLIPNGKGVRQGTILTTDFDTNTTQVNMLDSQCVENHPLNIVRRVV